MRGTLRFKDGAWRLQVYAGRDERTGKRKQVTRTVRAPDTRAGRKAADAELARLVLEVEAGRHRLDHDTTLAELLEQWVTASSIDWSPATTYQYRWTIEHRIVPHLGALPVHRLRAHDLNTLYAMLRRTGGRDGGPLASGTVQKVHVILHSALGYAVRSDLIAANPADAALKPVVVEGDIVPPTPTEVARALAEAAHIDPLVLAFVLIAAATGARRGQVVALRWPDLDLDAGEITRHLEVFTGPDPADLVFANQGGRPLNGPSFRGNIWLRALDSAGIDPGVRVHDRSPSGRIQANPCQLRPTSLGCEACHRTPPRATRR